MKISTELKILAAAALVAGSAIMTAHAVTAGTLDLSNTYAQAGGAGGGAAGGGTGGAGTGGAAGATGTGSSGAGADEQRDKMQQGLPAPGAGSSAGVPARCAAIADANQRQLCINQAASGSSTLRK